ncbi:MAG: aminopeptidase P family protein, partial [Planctomycetes bacterium]|nr:aminopeptidase P family protein [Planctomycetota bacterium]
AFAGASATVLIGAGQPIQKPGGLDQTYPFLPHPQYYWLTGSRRPGGGRAWEPGAGWTHFVRPVTAEERLWEGDPVAPEGADVATLPEWLKLREPRPVATLGSPTRGIAGDEAASTALHEALDAARRPKDAAELAILARAVTATAAGHARAREILRPGISERELMIELEAAMFRHGAEGVGYGTIVGAGAHAAVLHFEPGDRRVAAGDVVLIDAGGEIAGYTADVTRTWPANGRFTPEQQAIRDLVMAAHAEGIRRCRAGVEWHDVHRAAATVIATGLRDLGLLRGAPESLVESGASALFLPHGIGHMVGLGVRDVGGRAPGRPENRTCGGVRVRVDMPLQQGFLMTIEPGIYFVPAIIDDPAKREAFRDAVAWEALPRWRPVGGVRVEDNVLVTAGDPVVITAEIQA